MNLTQILDMALVFAKSNTAEVLRDALLIVSLVSIPLYILSLYVYEHILGLIAKKKKRKEIMKRIRKDSWQRGV